MSRYGRPAVVGSLGCARHATVDAFGTVRCEGVASLEWWVGADDRWYFPEEEPSLRQRLAGGVPVVETAMRVPSGDVVQRVYGVSGPGGPVVVEFDNRSPAALSLALVLRTAPRAFKRVVTVHGNVVCLARRPLLVLPREPLHWAVAAKGGAGTRPVVTAGLARIGPFPRSKSRTGVEAAFLFPVAHGTTRRGALLLDTTGGTPDAGDLPGADTVERGWAAQLERGLRVELPGRLTEAVGAARATLMLLGDPRARPSPVLIAALDGWGFAAEALAARAAARANARHEPARAATTDDAWGRVQAYLAAAGEVWSFPGGPSGFLGAVRDVLVREHEGGVDLLPGMPAEWLGQDLAVHDLPTPVGSVSFAVRWHGARPALLWDAPAGLSLRAPRLDPGWSAPGGEGEALLAEPSAERWDVH